MIHSMCESLKRQVIETIDENARAAKHIAELESRIRYLEELEQDLMAEVQHLRDELKGYKVEHNRHSYAPQALRDVEDLLVADSDGTRWGQGRPVCAPLSHPFKSEVADELDAGGQ